VDPSLPQSTAGSHPANPEIASRIQQECFKRGLILEVGGRHGAVVRFLPPLIITQEQLDEVIGIFKEAAAASIVR
jgi:diaminobutyrate-2-oxoglutarate transaminase